MRNRNDGMFCLRSVASVLTLTRVYYTMDELSRCQSMSIENT